MTANEIFLSGLGSTADGATIDLRITNTSEYRPWQAARNSLSRRSLTSRQFGVINLAGPSLRVEPNGLWREHFAIVELLFEFVADG